MGTLCRLVYDPKAFFLPHPRSRLDQAFAHCPKFLTAAQGAGTLFDSGVAVRSRKPAGDLWLGEPLPPTDLLIPGGIDHWRMYFPSANLIGWMMAPFAIVSGIWVSRDQWVDCSPELTRSPRLGMARFPPFPPPPPPMGLEHGEGRGGAVFSSLKRPTSMY